MTNRIRIAVVGGGLAGATVANALVKNSHVDVQVYESAPEFSERGAGIGLSFLALKALDEIIPSAADILKTDAGAVAIDAARVVVGSGPEAGTLVFDVGESKGLAMNRAPLLKALLAPLPKEILHAGRKLSSLEQTASGVEVKFADGAVEVFDAVIGADGLFSVVRNYVLEEGADEHAASPAGWWDCRNLVPVEKAKAALGENSFEIDREYAWVGEGAFMMHALVENRTMVQCIISAVEKDYPKDRKRSITREVLEDALVADWLDGPVAKGMVELMLDQEAPMGYSIWEHKTTPTYAKGRVCVLGDAAHTTSPWQGAGAGIAVEDALILGRLFSSIKSAEEVEAAFKAFDAVRRPRCQQVIESGRGVGQLFTGQHKDAGIDPEKMRGAVGPLFGHLDTLSLDDHKQDALNHLRKVQAN